MASTAKAFRDDIRLAELLGALSHALDITEGQPEGHCVRSCWIGVHLGREFGLSNHEIGELYYVLLLKDAGCSSTAARICQLFLTDDLSFKRDMRLIDGSLPQVLRFVLSHTGLKSDLASRFRALAEVVKNGGNVVKDLVGTRCQRGADIARRMRFSEAVAEGIHSLDEHWDGKGKPEGLAGKEIPLYARIAQIAQIVDVFHTSGGIAAARDEIRTRNGTWFDPALAQCFERVASRPQFWQGLKSKHLHKTVFELAPAQHSSFVDEDYLDDIAAAFAQVIDSKSPYTSGHSDRVTLFADLVAEEVGFKRAHRRWLKRAAMLHDIGKLGVSNQILDKPGKLDAEETREMQLHAAHTETILMRIGAFEDMAAIAGAHHERLDGLGYPKGLAGDEIAFETRILSVADVFDALTADRPYRAAMPVSKALAIMEEMTGPALDRDCFSALKSALKRVDRSMAA